MSFERMLPGSVVAERFEIESVEATGGMGVVFRARDKYGGGFVALKVFQGDLSQRNEAERFARESRALSELRHPGIVCYIAHGETLNGRPFLAMEWLEGEDLARRLERGPLSVPECLLLLRKIAAALAAAHKQGIVHRDLKPANLFLRGGRLDSVVLLDFGIARWVEITQRITRTGMILGTPQYMAPEQVRGDPDVDASADIFSLACIAYEGLTGQRPFLAEQIVALLAKIVFEDPVPVRQRRPDVPEAFGALLARMMAKEADRRPKDAEALLRELEAFKDIPQGPDVTLSDASIRTPRSLHDDEMQLFSAVLVLPAQAAEPGRPLDYRELDESRSRYESARELMTAFGAQTAWLADGSLLATLSHQGAATDRCAQAARCALALQERLDHRGPDRRPGLSIALATGRGIFRGRLPVGEVIDRAALLARRGCSPEPDAARARDPITEGIWLDELTASLLDARFAVARGAGWALLQGERSLADETRLLLGKPTPCVGRDRELGLLEMAFSGCADESEACAVLVTGAPGVGKSRLRHEFVRRVRAREASAQILVGRADMMSAGSPYHILGDAIRRLCGARGDEEASAQEARLLRCLGRNLTGDDAQRVCEFLGEISGVRFAAESSARLRAARNDPLLMSDYITQAFRDWLRAECACGPVLFILEDLHWSDGLTTKLLDVVLRDLGDSPLMVLALARPEVQNAFPALWKERRLQEIRLQGLSKKASERLVGQVLEQALGRPIGAQTLARIVEQAAGNALFLEELVRAVAEGKGDEMPETVLAMLHARLLRLDPGARRVLRAASVFGEAFRTGGVAALLSPGGDERELGEWLKVLTDAEIIERRRDGGDEKEPAYGFRHALVRDAAYGMLTEDDRVTGHKLAGAYLERIKEPNPMVIAEHYFRGGAPESALPFYIRAAEQAFTGTDAVETLARAERGIRCGAQGEDLGVLRALQCMAYYWCEDWPSALPRGVEAMDLLPRGSVKWCRTAGYVLMASSLLDPSGTFPRAVALFNATEPPPEARAAYIEALSMVTNMISYFGPREQARAFVDRVTQMAEPLVGQDAAVESVYFMTVMFYMRLLEADPWRNLTTAQSSYAAYNKIGSARYTIILELFVGHAESELGDPEGGEVTLRAALDSAHRLQEPLILILSKAHMGIHLAGRAARSACDEAITLTREVIAKEGVNSLVLGMTHAALARALLGKGELVEAESVATKARELLQMAPTERLRALDVLARARLGLGRVAEAVAAVEEGLLAIERLGCAGYVEVAFRLTAAEVYQAAGERGLAEPAVSGALRELRLRADKIPDPAVRERFLTRVPEHRRVLELAGSLSGEERP